MFDYIRTPEDDRFVRQVIDAADDHVLECGITADSLVWVTGPQWTCKICGEGMAVKSEIIPLG